MPKKSLPEVAVIGGGPAGLMAAEILGAAGVPVTVYDRMPMVGRKLLLAGRGGLNLTHSEPLERLLRRYGAAETRLRGATEAFPPADLRAWCEDLGQSTFIGSSGRVFPTAFKASPLLRAWLRRLRSSGVKFALRHSWTGWDRDGRLVFTAPDGARVTVGAAATVLALGGASWPRLGSDGSWIDVISRAGIRVTPLRPANCGFLAGWSEHFRERFEGTPVKRIALMFGATSVRGEIMVTRDGVEGGAIYALSAKLRDAIAATGEATLMLDLRPDVATGELARRLSEPRGKRSLSTFLRKAARLSPVAIGLMQEAAADAGEFPRGRPRTAHLTCLAPAAMAERIKAVPLRLTGTAPIARAISTAGGVAFDEVDETFMLRQRPGTFVAGEMLDWEAPTGGYLMQACFSTGAAAARGALKWIARDD